MSATVHACMTCYFPVQWQDWDSVGLWVHTEPGVYFHKARPLSVCPRCGHSVGQIIDSRCAHQSYGAAPYCVGAPCGCGWQIPPPDSTRRKQQQQTFTIAATGDMTATSM